ncbi:MAG: response regulator [Pseudomonadota bacterium]|nr:response regulator [Pseudomonadota bacterium]
MKTKLLVVDDNRLVLATLTEGLSRVGYDVIDADNGDDAILLAREHRPDLALLDIRMEGKSGFDVAAYLRDSCAIPFMFLSAFSDEQTVAQVKALGALDYLMKPLDIRIIVPAVAAALARLRAGNANVAAAAAMPGRGGTNTPPTREAVEIDIALATGLLMHRHSLDRQAAAQRLQQLADVDKRSLHEQATALLLAVEELARS